MFLVVLIFSFGSYCTLFTEFILGSGTSEGERLKSMIQSKDGGYLFCGETYGWGVSRNFDALVGKLDENGDILWMKNFARDGSEPGYYGETHCTGVEEGLDGSVFFSGGKKEHYEYDNGGNWASWYGKHFNTGVAHTSSGSILEEEGSGVFYFLNSGYVRSSPYQVDMIFSKISSSDGSRIWQKTFGKYPFYTFPCRGCFLRTSGGFLVGGNALTDDTRPKNRFQIMAKFDESADMIWGYRFGLGLFESTTSDSFMIGTVETSDGYVIGVGYTKIDTGEKEMMTFVKFNATSGSLEWNNLVVYDRGEISGIGVEEMMDGNYFVVGCVNSSRLFHMKISGVTGDIISSKYLDKKAQYGCGDLGDDKSGVLKKKNQTIDGFGGFIFGGTLDGSPDEKLMFISYDNSGETCGEFELDEVRVGKFNLTLDVLDLEGYATTTQSYGNFHDSGMSFNGPPSAIPSKDMCWSCGGKVKHRSDVCSGFGNCSSPDTCDCLLNYYPIDGRYCETTHCYGKRFNSSDVCGLMDVLGGGECVGLNNCVCNNSVVFGDECDVTSCHGVYSNVSQGLEGCSNHGNCGSANVPPGECDCDDGYFGEYCNITTCIGLFNHNQTDLVCSGHGRCDVLDHCECVEHFYDINCDVTFCEGVFSNDTLQSLCSGKGNCTNSSCDCELSYNLAKDCSVTTCNGTISNSSGLCSNHGTCWPKDVCQCIHGYYSKGVTCLKCPIGTYASWVAKNISMCEYCPKGRIGSVEGLNSINGCQICGVGTYSNTNRTICFPCPVGTHNNLTEKWDLSHCLSCRRGEYGDTISLENCFPCERGTYSNEEGRKTKCIPCPNGFWGNKEGKTSEEAACFDCPSGSYGESKGLKSPFQCTRCPKNTYQPETGKNSSDDCLPCIMGWGCPKGSSFYFEEGSFEEDTNYLQLIETEEYGNLEGSGRSQEYLTKVIIMSVVFFVLMLCVVCCYCLTHTIWVRKCANLRKLDIYFSLSHDIEEEDSVKKRSTNSGGAFSLLAIAISTIFISWSIIDFAGGNVSKKESVKFYFGSANDDRYWGDYLFGVTIHGNFSSESCLQGAFSSSGIQPVGNGNNPPTTQCDRLTERSCFCKYFCQDCSIVSSKDIGVSFSFNTEYNWVSLVEYIILLPHFDRQEDFFLSGKFYEENGTLSQTNLDVSLFPTEYIEVSIWNLITQIVNVEDFTPHRGLGASLKSSRKDVKQELDWGDGNTFSFLFNVEMGNFIFVVKEELKQSLLGYVAQIFALISLSISVAGIGFSFHNKIYSCCCSTYCCQIFRKREKVDQDEKMKSEELEELRNKIEDLYSLLEGKGITSKSNKASDDFNEKKEYISEKQDIPSQFEKDSDDSDSSNSEVDDGFVCKQDVINSEEKDDVVEGREERDGEDSETCDSTFLS